jgi:6-phosphogluconate dehydrogenase
MGANMVRRLKSKGHDAVVYDVSADAVKALVDEGLRGASSLRDLADQLTGPRAIWLMVPAAYVDSTVQALTEVLSPGDIIIDGGNSHYHDDLRRGGELAAKGIKYVDVGTSGGVWGLERGYCLMIGGERESVALLDPLFRGLAPGANAAPPTRNRHTSGTAELGYLHCGGIGAGHFVKMVHNGMMAAFAEGLNVLFHADVGKATHEKDAETTPLKHPELYQYDFDLPEISELWRRGSVVSSFLLDCVAEGFQESSGLEHFSGVVSDSGEGRWTLQAAIDEAVPVPVLSSALYSRFESRAQAQFANRVLSAMRFAFGGHREKPTKT